MFWMRRRPALKDTALAMVDPRSHDTVLIVGGDAPALAGQSSEITRLNGRTAVIVRSDAERAAVEKAASDAGGLVYTLISAELAIPLDEPPFQIIVLANVLAWPAAQLSARLTDVARSLAPGGRVIAIAGVARAGAFARLSTHASTVDEKAIIATMTGAGLVAARKLASENGVDYFEARKARP